MLASIWAAAGIDVELRTCAERAVPSTVSRSGYRTLRRGGRYTVFARRGAEALWRRPAPSEGLVEVWNGMPFFSPLWWRGPRLVLLHQVHAELWRLVLPPRLARLGEEIELRLAPPLYRSSTIATLSRSSREAIVERLGLPAEQILVIAPGVSSRFSPGPASSRSSAPLVVAVGRLVPVKQFDLLLRACARARERAPDLRLVIVGEGYDRARLEHECEALGATSWTTFAGRVSTEELVGWYRSAWVVASASYREGWGMTLTEAAACGTPAVASAIAGHRDAVVDGTTGLLALGEAGLGRAIGDVLCDSEL
ncbi:MAG: glycosyltransferase family 4 protein, partial [Gaiellaceae bacterium]